MIKYEEGKYVMRKGEYKLDREWQGLTDDEIRAIDDITLGDYYVEKQAIDFARAIEQALKEKNT